MQIYSDYYIVILFFFFFPFPEKHWPCLQTLPLTFATSDVRNSEIFKIQLNSNNLPKCYPPNCYYQGCLINADLGPTNLEG